MADCNVAAENEQEDCNESETAPPAKKGKKISRQEKEYTRFKNQSDTAIAETESIKMFYADHDTSHVEWMICKDHECITEDPLPLPSESTFREVID